MYAVEVDIDDGKSAPQRKAGGVANIGVRPTFEKGCALRSAFIDHDCDLYGQRLLVRLKAFLRPERDLPALTNCWHKFQ